MMDTLKNTIQMSEEMNWMCQHNISIIGQKTVVDEMQ